MDSLSAIFRGSCSSSLMENICWGVQANKGSSKPNLGQSLYHFCPHVVKHDAYRHVHTFTACSLALLLDLQYGER